MTLQRIALMGAGSVAASGYTMIDADAAAWVANVEGASGDNQTLEDGIKQAVDAYVQTLKANSILTAAAQFLLPCGPRTLAGALRPLKGPVPTNVGFLSGNYNRKSGLGDTANLNKYIDSNVAMNTIPPSSNGFFAYGSITAASGDRALVGWYSGSGGSDLFSLDEWAAYVSGRAFRSGTASGGGFPVSTSTAAATCMIGSRTALNSAALYVDGSTITNTTTVSFSFNSTQRLWYYTLNNNNTATAFSRSVLQSLAIFSTGLNATQAAALRTATATYVAAVAAAIP